MNRFKRKIAEWREAMSDTLSHIGWMFWGQQCDCGKAWPNLNRPAARIARYLDTLEYTDNYECKQWQGRAAYSIGAFFCNASSRMLTGRMMNEYFATLREENPPVFEIVEPKKPRKKWTSLSPDMRLRMHEEWRDGVPVKELAKRYDVTLATAYRYIRQVGVSRIMAMLNDTAGVADVTATKQ